MRIVVCGDFVCQDPENLQVDERLKAIFQQSDYVALNFEAPIAGFGKPIHKSGPALYQSPHSPCLLEELGVNIVLMANNHMMDYGKEGCLNSISAFKSTTTILGVGGLNDAYTICVVEKSGIKVGMLNFTHREFGVLGIDSCDSDYGTAWVNHPNANRAVLEAKKHCDILIVLPHAGVEDILVPLPEWRARYKEFIDFGADIVIASHPHTPQGWENYKGKRIFYSLGNFFFSSFSKKHTDNWYKGLIVDIDIDSKHKISYTVHNTKFTDRYLELDNTSDSVSYNNYLCNLLSSDNCYQNCLNTSLMSLWPTYKLYNLRGLAAISPTLSFSQLIHTAYGLFKGIDYPLLVNNYQCESHNWAITRILNLLNTKK